MNESKNKPKYNLDWSIILHIPNKKNVQTQACNLGQKAREENTVEPPVTPTLKGNEKQFEFSGSIVKFTLPC